MNRTLTSLAILAVGIGVGLLGARLWQVSDDAADSEREPLYWVAPMDPNYRRDKPGKSPMGMDLVPVYREHMSGDEEGGVRISPVVENNIGLRTGMVTRSDLHSQIRTVGYVQFNEDRLSHIHPRVEGWIEKLHASSVGEQVTQGQLLFELYAPALVNAQQEYLAALGSGNRQLTNASAERLRLLGVDRGEIEQLARTRKTRDSLPFYSDRDGYLSHLDARSGMFVRPASEIMSIGDLRDIWVLAEVFERQLEQIRVGAAVRIRSASAPGREWLGEVDYVYPTLDAASRTGRVRIVVANEDEALKPNLAVDLLIHAGTRQGVLSIPREALIRGGRADRVVKRVGDGHYRSVPVQAGTEAGERVEILEGLQEGDVVVTSAQFLIDSESGIDADMQRMEERGDTPTEATSHEHHDHHQEVDS